MLQSGVKFCGNTLTEFSLPAEIVAGLSGHAADAAATYEMLSDDVPGLQRKMPAAIFDDEYAIVATRFPVHPAETAISLSPKVYLLEVTVK